LVLRKAWLFKDLIMFQNPKFPENIKNKAHRVSNTHKTNLIGTYCKAAKLALKEKGRH
jgi:hypothetical protein